VDASPVSRFLPFRRWCRASCRPPVIISRTQFPPLAPIYDRKYYKHTIPTTVTIPSPRHYIIQTAVSSFVHLFQRKLPHARAQQSPFLLVWSQIILHIHTRIHSHTPIVVFGASHTDHRQKHNGATLLFRVRLRRR